MRRARASDGGVTIVEASFVLPLLFMFMFGLVDLGMWTFNANQASNAARDGARAGILAYPLRGVTVSNVDEKQDSARQAVVTAIQERLPEATVADDDVTIECLSAAVWSATACHDPHPERIRVGVEWHWELVTPIAAVVGVDEGAARASATMEIVGRPLAGSGGTDPDSEDPLNPPPVEPCQISGLTAPAEVFTKGNQLSEPMPISFTYTSGDCSDLQVVLTGTKSTGAEQVVHLCGCDDAPDHNWIYAGSNNIWKANGNRGVVAVFNGDDHSGTPLARVEFKVS